MGYNRLAENTIYNQVSDSKMDKSKLKGLSPKKFREQTLKYYTKPKYNF
ncbi:hypothetical protein SE1039_25710 [Staphylococcus equorum]|nr:hypothetical protein SE1039_25710 [Staphylococcus equorum]